MYFFLKRFHLFDPGRQLQMRQYAAKIITTKQAIRSQLIAIGILAAAVFLSPLPAFAKTDQPAEKWQPHVDMEGRLGSERSLGELGFFMPLAQDNDTLFFSDIRARFDNSDNNEGNFGFGVRQMQSNGWNLGAYGYYDRRHSETGKYYNQATLGVEALTQNLDLRANVYQPFGSRSHVLSSTAGGTSAQISGSTVQIVTTSGSETREVAMGGFDAEVGIRMPVFSKDDTTQLRAYAGGYHFDADDARAVEGPRGRLQLTLDEVPYLWNGSRVDFGAEIQHDDPRGTQQFLTVRLRIPLQFRDDDRPARALSSMERRMTDPIVRDIDIVSQPSVRATGTSSVETADETAGGQTLTLLTTSNTTGANLPASVAAAGANSTVIVSGTFNTSAIVALQAGQTLIGGGDLGVRNSGSGRTATLTLSGGTITGAVAGNNPAVAMANNSTLTGMTVSNTATGGGTPNPFAVRANGVTGATVSNNTLTGIGDGGGGTAQALLITGASSNISVLNNTLTATGITGITVGLNVVNSTNILVVGNTMSATSNPPATQSRAIVVNNGSFSAGSTGNTIINGICSVALAGTGSIGLVGGGTCP